MIIPAPNTIRQTVKRPVLAVSRSDLIPSKSVESIKGVQASRGIFDSPGGYHRCYAGQTALPLRGENVLPCLAAHLVTITLLTITRMNS